MEEIKAYVKNLEWSQILYHQDKNANATVTNYNLQHYKYNPLHPHSSTVVPLSQYSSVKTA